MNRKSLLLSCLLVLILLPILPACGQQNSTQPSTHNSSSAKSQRSISLNIGESIELDVSGLALKFVAIKEDSRCPRNTACIQEGQVTALFNLFRQPESRGQTFELTLKTLQPGLATQNIEGYTIKLNRVDPYPDTETAKSDRRYSVSLLIERLD